MKRLCAAVAVFLCMVPALAEEDCRLTIAAALPVSPDESGRLSVPASIGGKDIRLMVDTGSPSSVLTQGAAEKLGLEVRVVTAPAKFRLYGGEHLKRYVRITDFRLGKLTAPNAEFLVMPDRLSPGVDGLLGADFIAQFDVDFDFAAAKLNLFEPHRCPGRVVYWTQDEAAIAVIPFETRPYDSHIEIAVAIDGKPIKAIVDTGASTSTLNVEAAAGLGVATDGLKAVGNTADPNYTFPFKTLSFEGVTVTSPRIILVPRDKSHFTDYRALLGITVLRQLHLFIAYKERKLYATAADAH